MHFHRFVYIIPALFVCSLQAFAADSTRIIKLYDRGYGYLDRLEYDSAGMVFQQGLDLSRRSNNHFLEATGLYNQSRSYELSNNLSTALETLEDAMAIFDRIGRKKNVANCYNSYNRIYQTLGNYAQALSYGLRALRIKEALNDQAGLAVALTNVGNVYLLTEHFDDALVHFTRALAIDSANNDSEGISISLLNIGVAFQKKGNYSNALNKYRQALDIVRQLGNKGDEVWLLNNIGSTLRQSGKPDSSLVYLISSLSTAEKYNINSSHILNDLAETYLAINKPEAAKKHALEAVDASEKEQNLGQLVYAWQFLGDSYEKLGNYPNAYHALKQHTVFKDSLLNVKKAALLNNLKVQYESEKKEQTIALLTKEKASAAFRRNAYLASGVLIAVILLLLYNRQRLNSKKNRLLYEKGKEVDKMKTTFFSNISHEFRTPLTLILGPVQSLLSLTTDPKMIRQLNTMERNAQRLLGQIDQLLYLSKLESDKPEISLTRLNIIPLIRGTVMNFSSMADDRQINLQVETPMPGLTMDVDKEKIETVIINLLSNAFKFTPRGGSITVTVDMVEKGNTPYCGIRIQDTGMGINEKDIPHVFDRFYQSNDRQKAQQGGSGIGLALVKELVKLHKGSINIVSKPNEGAEVTVLLPLPEDYTVQQSPGAGKKGDEVPVSMFNPLPAENWEEPEVRKTIVLVIEDNADVMLYIKDVLQNEYHIVEAANGAEGILKAIETIPDLVISDVMMPEKDGYEVCSTLKQDERTSHIPLILLTAKVSFEDKLHGLQQKADEYLTKPFSPKELLLRVANLISSRKALREKYSKELVLKPLDVTVPSIEEAFLQKVMLVAEERIADESFTVVDLATEVGMSRSQLHRKLQALTNQSATEFIRSYRLTKAMDMIKQHAGSVAEIGYKVGFSSPSYFNKMFLQQYGITPGQARTKQS
ncbi:tetratricopeptide repeat protein [Agriterribacter sp.]|uniref:tetratricopeptide repeat protein n=1 Tax=Agriterribacter sp. TaxID=2821509 RepID=UPI002C746ECB|nr:tetratricopeptide repeat protein [Agriterribacter sp.]HRP58395.1 tetratricopeptide repeat protein [Agriterribacter sp.]